MGFIQPETKGPETSNKATINLLSAVPTLLETQKLLDAYSYHVLASLLDNPDFPKDAKTLMVVVKTLENAKAELLVGAMASEAFKTPNEPSPSLLLYMVDLIQKLRGNPPPGEKQ
jgi:hypothetical protein